MQVPASLSCLFEERIVHEYLLPAAIAIAGAILLILGSGLLVRGASGLVTRIGLSLEMIGVIVIALGATMPVLATSAIASYRGESGLAVGTIVGSNIFGVLFILGLSALLTPLTAAARLIRLDVPLVVLVSLAVLGLAWKGYIGRADGVGLVIAALAYVGWTAFLGRGETSPVREDLAQLVRSGPLQSPRSLIVQVILGVTGLGLILLGAYCLVRGVADLADLLKIDSRLAALTALAIGAIVAHVDRGDLVQRAGPSPHRAGHDHRQQHPQLAGRPRDRRPGCVGDAEGAVGGDPVRHPRHDRRIDPLHSHYLPRLCRHAMGRRPVSRLPTRPTSPIWSCRSSSPARSRLSTSWSSWWSFQPRSFLS